jgi:hypothetical protein
VNAQTSIVTPVVAMMTLGTAHALNDLGPSSQPEVTSPEGLGTAAEFFQTARFVATGLAGDLSASSWRMPRPPTVGLGCGS